MKSVTNYTVPRFEWTQLSFAWGGLWIKCEYTPLLPPNEMVSVIRLKFHIVYVLFDHVTRQLSENKA